MWSIVTSYQCTRPDVIASLSAQYATVQISRVKKKKKESN